MNDETGPLAWPSVGTVGTFIRADLRANRRDPKASIVVVALRITQMLMGDPESPRPAGRVAVVIYRLMTEFFLSMEIRPRTRIGAGLSIYHGFGIVINDHCVIGSGVAIRNGVTIGHAVPGGGVPRIGNRVSIGANAVVIGDIEIGDGAVIGAGAVVTKNVIAGGVATGNPATVRARAAGAD